MSNNNNNGPAFKYEDIFKDSRFLNLEEYTKTSTNRMNEIELKIKNINIHSFDTSEFIKTDEFDKSINKLLSEFEEIKSDSINLKENLKKSVTKIEIVDFIRKGVVYHINEDIKWEGVDSMTK